MSWAVFAVAAMVGGVARFELMHRLNTHEFAWGTALVNLLGAFLAGMLEARLEGAWRTVVVVGLLGAFTTFSSFAEETRHLAAEHGLRRAAAFGTLNSVGALLAAVAGLATA